ncbi:MAG: hypothetical protein ABIJ36_00685 [Patescibacteria group bacterium]|nr:hypothetical protein [Patescibacteria group bacterium]
MQNISDLTLTIKVFKEASSKEYPFVAYNPEFDISSCGKTQEEAQRMLKQAIHILLEGATEDKTLYKVLEEAGFSSDSQKPEIYFSLFSLPIKTSNKYAYA